MRLNDMNKWGPLRRDGTISTRGLGRKKHISYLSAELLKPYQSLYIILSCQSQIRYWKL